MSDLDNLKQRYTDTIKKRDKLRDEILLTLTWKQFKKSGQDFKIDCLKNITKNKRLLQKSQEYTDALITSRILSKQIDSYLYQECFLKAE